METLFEMQGNSMTIGTWGNSMNFSNTFSTDFTLFIYTSQNDQFWQDFGIFTCWRKESMFYYSSFALFWQNPPKLI